MIVCQCNVLLEREIEETILALLMEDPWALVVPSRVYHALGKRGRCCQCFPSVVSIILRVMEDLRHSDISAPGLAPALEMRMMELKNHSNVRLGARGDLSHRRPRKMLKEPDHEGR